MAAVIAAVLALLATPTSNAVAVAPGESFPGYAYDGTRASEPFDDTAAERGPPGPNDRAMTYDAVDRWSHGASASPDIATPGPTRTYTAPGGPPQVVEAAGKTQAGARADVGGLSSLARAGVAANTARAADAVPNPTPVYRPNGAPDRSSPWYVSYRDADGNVQTVGNLNGVHAEVRIQQMQPGAPMSRPFGWRTLDSSAGPQWVEGTVCRGCQVYPRSLFPPGTGGAPGGPWGD
ncbi:hypothetical protein CUD01_18750 [Cellulomonas uda]|uniref:SH3b domain-containing protein n=1 Tax=Cellulomonas uda TaxID=1714 RepID=A0A4Y3KAC0_CELUD|nr:hypothetical protein CUD01_18750 [Cellulomonas uda]